MAQVEAYVPLIGKEVRYLDEKGKLKSRILKGISFNQRKRIHIADLEYQKSIYNGEGFKRLFLGTKKVPLTSVIVPKTAATDSVRHDVSKPQDVPLKSFIYNNHYYTVKKCDSFIPGHEVVWTTYSNHLVACIGTVILTAGRQDVLSDSDKEEVAIVSLCSKPSIGVAIFSSMAANFQFPVVIPQCELLTLEEWTSIMQLHDVNKTKGEEPQPITPEEMENNDMDEFRSSQQKKRREKSSKNRKSKIDQGGPAMIHDSSECSLPLDVSRLFDMIENTGGFQLGIEGSQNSCYIDAALVALFAFCHKLDEYMTQISASEIIDIMKHQVVPSLRKELFVPKESIHSLRRSLAKFSNNPGYIADCMDAEDFISDLLQGLQIQQLISYDDDGGDYMHQITLPFDWTSALFCPLLSVQTLITDSIKTYEVASVTLQNETFIVKLPVSSGKLVPASGVVPNLTLLLPCADSKNRKYIVLDLHAVVCLKNLHYTTFVRVNMDETSDWVYFDSCPGTGLPYVERLQGINAAIEQATSNCETAKLNEISYDIGDPSCKGVSIFANAYICVYIMRPD